MRRLTTIEPSSVFADNNIGDVIQIGDKWYCLLVRDPWTVKCCRYYWFDPFLAFVYRILYGIRIGRNNGDRDGA